MLSNSVKAVCWDAVDEQHERNRLLERKYQYVKGEKFWLATICCVVLVEKSAKEHVRIELEC